MNQDHVRTQPIREFGKRRLEDRIASNTLLVFIALDVVLRIVEIALRR